MRAARIVVGCSVVTALALALGNVGAAVVSLLSLPLWYSSLERRSHRRALAGAVVSLAGIVVAGVGGLDTFLLVVASIGLIVGWATATQFVDLRTQLDETATIERALYGHAGATLASVSGIATVVYAVSLLELTVPALALVLIFVGTVPVLFGLDWLGR